MTRTDNPSKGQAFRDARIPLAHGAGAMPVVGFGTLIPDPVDTREATKTTTNVRFNSVVQTGVPGFIPKVQ
jgi:hypothetical protein